MTLRQPAAEIDDGGIVVREFLLDRQCAAEFGFPVRMLARP
jgi:hypothetical protein